MQKKFEPFETKNNVLMSDSLKDEISFEQQYEDITKKKKNTLSNVKFIFQVSDSLLEINVKKFNINKIKLEYNQELLKYLLDKFIVEKFETNIAFILKIDDLEILREEKVFDISFTKKSIELQFLNTY
jgi:hypothetical protein